MEIRYPEIGICGLSCRLCPSYQTEAASRCGGCKSADRIAVGCPFITCAIKKIGVEFCWDCRNSESCEKWKRHRETGQEHDSFKSYQKLEDDIKFITSHGVELYDEQQRTREALLIQMLNEFNEGRSKSYYCIAATVMEIDELRDSIQEARARSKLIDIKSKSQILHLILDRVAQRKGYCLNLRKKGTFKQNPLSRI